VTKTELIKMLQDDLEQNGDGDVVIRTVNQLRPNSLWSVSKYITADGRRFVLGALSRIY